MRPGKYHIKKMHGVWFMFYPNGAFAGCSTNFRKLIKRCQG